MIAPARLAAYDVLRAVNTGRADLPDALARARRTLPDERDRSLAGEIATGTLRWQGAFDYVIAAFARRPVGRLDPEVLDILRMSVFQILHLDRVPPSAAVDEAVNLTRKAGKKSAAGFVNALLRRVSRQRGTLPLPSPPAPGDPLPVAASYLAVALSHPEWLVARWIQRYGFEAAEAWCRFNNDPARLMLRANRLRTSPAELTQALAGRGVEVEPARFAPDGLVVRRGNPLLTPLADEGLFLVQDEASQLVSLLTGVRPGQVVLDACASPGGKTTAMAAAMSDTGLIAASDIRGRRVGLLSDTVRVSGASCVHVVRADASAALPFRRAFDCVLLDAPCSGLGTVRRDPDIKWRRTADELPRLAALQLTMLNRAADVVKAGGRLVYATCSSEPEENEEVVAAFLVSRADFELRSPEDSRLTQFVTQGGHFRTLPFRDRLEAFFGAILVKTKDLR